MLVASDVTSFAYWHGPLGVSIRGRVGAGGFDSQPRHEIVLIGRTATDTDRDTNPHGGRDANPHGNAGARHLHLRPELPLDEPDMVRRR